MNSMEQWVILKLYCLRLILAHNWVQGAHFKRSEPVWAGQGEHFKPIKLYGLNTEAH